MISQPGSVIAHIFQAWEVSFLSISQAGARGFFCWRKAWPTLTEIVDFEAHEIQNTKKFRMRICFFFVRKIVWLVSFCQGKISVGESKSFTVLGVRRDIYWYLFDCNFCLTKLAMVEITHLSRCSTRIFFTILVVGMGRWNHSRQVMPW